MRPTPKSGKGNKKKVNTKNKPFISTWCEGKYCSKRFMSHSIFQNTFQTPTTNLSRCRDQSPSTDSLTWRRSNIRFNSQIKNVDSSSLKTFTFCFPETFLPVEKPSQLSSESSLAPQVCFYPNMCPNDKPWRSAGVWVSPNHKHQHCWVQFRNWFLRLCGLRRPILFLLDTSKYYGLIFTHLPLYICFMAL